LVVGVLLIPSTWIGPANGDIYIWRKDVLAIIITAFGAWVGARAAYFFSRENLRVAADSLLAMRDISGKERLRKTSIKQIPPTPIDWTLQCTDTVVSIQAEMIAKPERWFVPVIKQHGTLDTVINEEAAWRFLLQPTPPAATATVADLFTFISSTAALKRFMDIQASSRCKPMSAPRTT
jgi:alpha-beta hydrolase superfamily lysophospholipase